MYLARRCPLLLEERERLDPREKERDPARYRATKSLGSQVPRGERTLRVVVEEKSKNLSSALFSSPSGSSKVKNQIDVRYHASHMCDKPILTRPTSRVCMAAITLFILYVLCSCKQIKCVLLSTA